MPTTSYSICKNHGISSIWDSRLDSRDERRDSKAAWQATADDPTGAAGGRAARGGGAAQSHRGGLPSARRPDSARALGPDRGEGAALRLQPAGRAALQPIADLQALGDPP